MLIAGQGGIIKHAKNRKRGQITEASANGYRMAMRMKERERQADGFQNPFPVALKGASLRVARFQQANDNPLYTKSHPKNTFV